MKNYFWEISIELRYDSNKILYCLLFNKYIRFFKEPKKIIRFLKEDINICGRVSSQAILADFIYMY